MFEKKHIYIFGSDAIAVSGLGDYSLSDTMECGQCFRHVRLTPDGSEYVEYMTVASGKLIFVGQRSRDELIFFGVSDGEFENICVPYFALDADYGQIRTDILENTDSEFLKNAAEEASVIRILRQEPWEALFSFIVSQNNNLPRIKKIIRSVCSQYGENLAVKEGLSSCPMECGKRDACGSKLDTGRCSECGICYSFPTADAVKNAPELLLPSHPGFRYKYLVDAAERVTSGEVDLENIARVGTYENTVTELMKIKGVGEKVASCAALFAFGNLEAFPIDVWMRRAIDEYFGGVLDPLSLGKYAGVAQQYIFHYIRKLSDIV